MVQNRFSSEQTELSQVIIAAYRAGDTLLLAQAASMFIPEPQRRPFRVSAMLISYGLIRDDVSGKELLAGVTKALDNETP